MKTTTKLLLLISGLSFQVSAFADLYVTGTPGFTFSDTPAGRATSANLNRALQFTYAIAGTIGGTNAGLAAKSVSGTMLMDNVAGTNLTWDVAAPRALQIKNGGVGPYQLTNTVAGSGLSGGDGAPLAVNTGSGLAVTNDYLTVTNLLPGALTVASNSIVMGYSNNVAIAVPLPAGLIYDGTSLFLTLTTNACRAVFSGTNLYNPYNISAVTNTAAGFYSITFSTPLLSTNYGVVLSAQHPTAVWPWVTDKYTNYFKIRVTAFDGTDLNPRSISVQTY